MPRFPQYFRHSLPPRIKWNAGLLARLPQCYRDFYEEWQYGVKTPVHWLPHEKEYVRNTETGEIKRFENHEIPVIHPPESHQGIWGGEGVIYGFEKRHRYKAKVPMFYTPFLVRSVVYSEVLNKYLSTVVTQRTLSLIDEHKGFDLYLLQTSAADLQSALALKLKRLIYLTLANGDLPHEDPERKAELLKKYEAYRIPTVDAEWYGLTLREASQKLDWMEENIPTMPLKDIFRQELVRVLRERRKPEEVDDVTKEESSGTFSGLFSRLTGSGDTKPSP